MTDLPRKAPARETPAIPRETPQKSPNTYQRRLAAAALAGAVLIACAASVIILGARSAGPPVSRGTTSTTGYTGGRGTSTTTSTRTAASPPAEPALAAVSTYWEAIGRHDFAAAYAILAPGAVPQTEAQWASTEQSTDIERVRFKGEVSDASGTGATVRVLSLVTVDQRFGCRSWTGTYQMTSEDGRWLISKAAITPQRCSTGLT